MKAMPPFIILAERRSGTTLLIDYLNNTSRISCEKRLFGIERRVVEPTPDHHSSLFFLYRTAAWSRRLRYYLSRTSLLWEFLDRSCVPPPGSDRITGFRLLYSATEHYPQILDWAERRQARILHLVRENILKTYISTETARIHKLHHPRIGDRLTPVAYTVDTSGLLANLHRRTERIERMRRLIADRPHRELSYEHLSADPGAVARDILPFLGAPVEPFRSDLVKINPDRLSDLVTNYEQVADVLAGTPYVRFLET